METEGLKAWMLHETERKGKAAEVTGIKSLHLAEPAAVSGLLVIEGVFLTLPKLQTIRAESEAAGAEKFRDDSRALVRQKLESLKANLAWFALYDDVVMEIPLPTNALEGYRDQQIINGIDAAIAVAQRTSWTSINYSPEQEQMRDNIIENIEKIKTALKGG